MVLNNFIRYSRSLLAGIQGALGWIPAKNLPE
jgi:hypothetical protein